MIFVFVAAGAMERSSSISNGGFPSTCFPIAKPRRSKSGCWPIPVWRSSAGIAEARLQKCKWKQYIAAFGTNTCRFLVHIAGKVALPMINSEQILAVIPNSEAILCHHLKSSEQAYDV